MYSALTTLALALILITCAPATCAAPIVEDKRDVYTGRLFAHHAHERVGPTPAAPISVVATVTATSTHVGVAVAWNSAVPTASAQE